VTILSPVAGSETSKESIPVRVSIVAPFGQAIVPPKVFANGVIAGDRKLVSTTRTSDAGGHGQQEWIYQWQANLPSDPRIRIQAVAATESEIVGTDALSIDNRSQRSGRNRRLYIAAAAVGQYQDSQIPRLEAVVHDTRRLAETLEKQSAAVYKTHSIPFFENVTRVSWNVALDQLAERMRREASADDLLVILLSGHGVRDEESGEYYYLPSDASFAEVMARQYDKCISGRDLARFSDIPCRKLVVIDTCHSGAIRPFQQRQLKSLLRLLQDDMMFTLTASRGQQQAVQSRFARRLDEALRGAADRQTGDNDGFVTLEELGTYVRAMVMADSAGEGTIQTPTVGPRDLVRQVSFPVTSHLPYSAVR